MLLGAGVVSGIDHHAFHAKATYYRGWADGSAYDSVNAQTSYTLNPSYSTADGTLVGQVVDEVFLTITFDVGFTPSIEELGGISYGSELSLAHNDEDLRWRVSGQDLHIWYGFQDQGKGYGPSAPLLAANNKWSFAIKGKNKILSAKFFVSWHGVGQAEMPALSATDRLLEITQADLNSDAEGMIASGRRLADIPRNERPEKIIVMIHGWNPHGRANHYAPAKGESDPAWNLLGQWLFENSAVKSQEWAVARYDWALDASTGEAPSANEVFDTLSQYGPFGVVYDLVVNKTANANASRDAASAHGLKLGQALSEALSELNPKEVHFVAHSAGNWMARRAAAYLRNRFGSNIRIQHTCLDPFVNDDLGLVPCFQLESQWVDRIENYFAIDGAFSSESKTDPLWMAWTSGNFSSNPVNVASGTEAAWVNQDIAELGASGLFEPEMVNHSGPVVWYAKSGEWGWMATPALSQSRLGFINSLAATSVPADNFPGTTLSPTPGGSTPILNLQATAQAGEPSHGANGSQRTVWLNWQAPASGLARFGFSGNKLLDSTGSPFGNNIPLMAVYSGSSLGSLTLLANNTTGSVLPSVEFNVVQGQTYHIALDGYNGDRGVFSVLWSMDGVSPPNTPLITAPAADQTVTGTVDVDASATSANAVEFYLDGIKQHRDEATPFSWSWNTLLSASGSHQLSVKSLNGEAFVGTSASLVVNVSNTINPVVDVDEPNDRSTQATGPLASGFVKTAKINSSSDVDWYRFDVTGPGVIDLRLAAPYGIDYDLELYSSNSGWLAGASDTPQQAGSLDPSFGSGGSVISATSGKDGASFIAIQTDGKPVLAGTKQWQLTDYASVARYTDQGALDSSFGTGGFFSSNALGSADGIAIQSDGKILVIGRASFDFGVLRLLPNGNLDAEFGVGGKVVTDVGGNDKPKAIAVDGAGRIVVVGESLAGNIGVVRYLQDGALDLTFGQMGKVRVPGVSAQAVALGDDGELTVAGYVSNGSDVDFLIARFLENGAPDPSFGSGGRALVQFGNNSEFAYRIALLPDGRILVTGETFVGSGYVFAMARLMSDGTMDGTFGSGGKVVDISSLTSRGLILQDDGRFLVARKASLGGFELARYTSSGAYDLEFGIDGKSIVAIGVDGGSAIGVALDKNRRAVVCGSAAISEGYPLFAAARFNTGASFEKIQYTVHSSGTYYARVYGYPAGNGSFSAADPYALSYTFTPGLVTPTRSLETIASNGTVLRSNPGPNYSEGQAVMLTPVPNPGFQFAGWSMDASGTANPLTVSMSTDKKIVASFTPVASTSFQGNVTVNLEPPEAVAAGAQWRLVSDGVWRDSGATAALSTQGLQTAEFKTTTGYFSPGKQTVSISRAANDLRLTGTYRLKAFDTGSGFLDVGDFPPTLSCIAGQSASLTVQAVGTGTLTYQWFLGAYPVVGATSATLVLTDVQTSLVGEKFSCVVSNGSLSKQTNGCELITLSPPSLSQSPASASAPAGGAVSFRVAATGTSPFRYQWKKAGTDIAGATDDFLRLTNLQASDASSYTVVVSNDAGSATSNAAALTVNGPAPALSGNDSFAGASLIADAAITQIGNNASATREAGEPLVTGTVGGHSLWWKWAAPSAGRVTITTEGSNFDTTLGIYIGNVLNALALVAEDDDGGGRAITSTVSFDTVAGQTYNIAVDGHDAADTGDIRLRIDLSPSVSAPAPSTAIHEVLAVMGQSPLGLKPQALAQHADGSLFVCYGDGGPYSIGSIVKHNLDGTTALMHAFTGADGSFPNRIIRASDGNFYGTTLAGGANNLGGLFKVTPSGDCTLLTSFTTANGYDSKWIMEGSNGFLYIVQRTTSSGAVVGSVLKCSKSAGVAQVKFYQVPSGLTNGHSPVHLCELADGSFALTCTTGGANSRGAVRFLSSAGVSLLKVDLTTDITTSGNALGLVQAPDGLLYGTSRSGGANSAGTIFSLNTTGVLTALYAFPSGSGTTSASAVAPPVLGPDGKIYGVTYGGGANGLGSAYAYEIGVGYSLLTSFTSTTAAGRLPVCLARGSDGNLYGASAFGGQNNTGAIFGLSTAGVFVFTRPVESSLGTIPTRVSQTSDGTLYWMTNEGGPSNYGQVWKKTPGSDAVVLVPLNGTVSNPARSAVLLPALDGNFYFMSSNASGVGALVRVSPAGASARVATFTSGTSGTGTSPQGYLVQAADGTFYGTASAGGTNGEGTIFKYTTAGGLVALASMATATTGRTPTDVVLGGDGNLYAISTAGAGATGAIFSVTPSGTTTPVFVPTSTSAFGSTPRSLSIGEDGLIYASTSGTGTSGGPTVFEVTSAGSTRLVGVFSNATTGSPVEGPLAQDDNDDLFGTAPTGGNNGEGTLFKLSQGGAISVLHHFDLESGNGPQYGVIRGADGDLYGSTYHQYGVATIYRVTYLPPEIISTSPSQAPPGATVTITGKHFAQSSRVQFGNLDAPSFLLVSNTEIAAVVPAGFRSGAISVTSTLGTGISAAYSAPALSSLQLWREAYFGTAESADMADDLNDLEGDGVKNLAEFAFGMNPYAGGQHDRMPKGTEATYNSQRYLAISFRRRIGETSIAYEVEESDDMSAWTTLNIPAQQVGLAVNNGDGTETVTVRASVPMNGPGSRPKCFLRVAVRRNP